MSLYNGGINVGDKFYNVINPSGVSAFHGRPSRKILPASLPRSRISHSIRHIKRSPYSVRRCTGLPLSRFSCSRLVGARPMRELCSARNDIRIRSRHSLPSLPPARLAPLLLPLLPFVYKIRRKQLISLREAYPFSARHPSVLKSVGRQPRVGRNGNFNRV